MNQKDSFPYLLLLYPVLAFNHATKDHQTLSQWVSYCLSFNEFRFGEKMATLQQSFEYNREKLTINQEYCNVFHAGHNQK